MTPSIGGSSEFKVETARMTSEVETSGRVISAGRSTRIETASLLDQPCQCPHCGLLSIELRLIDRHFFARYGLDACR